MGACASPQFIQDDQWALGCTENDGWGLRQLFHERTTSFVDVVWRPHPDKSDKGKGESEVKGIKVRDRTTFLSFEMDTLSIKGIVQLGFFCCDFADTDGKLPTESLIVCHPSQLQMLPVTDFTVPPDSTDNKCLHTVCNHSLMNECVPGTVHHHSACCIFPCAWVEGSWSCGCKAYFTYVSTV